MNQVNHIKKLDLTVSFLKIVCGICGILYLLYIFSPIRFWDKLVIPSQLEVLKISFIFINILLSVVLITQIFHKEKSLKFSLIDVFVVLFSLYLLIVFFIQPNQMYFETKFRLLISTLSYIFIRASNPKFYLLYFFVLLVAGFLQIGYGIVYQVDFSQSFKAWFSNITGDFYNTGPWGGFVSILIIISFFNYIYNTKAYNHKYIYLFYTLALVPFLAASDSRAAWLTTIISILYIVIINTKSQTIIRSLKYKLGILAFTLILIPTLIFGLYKYRESSVDGRFLIWQVSVNMIKDKPLTGYGIDGFQRNYMKHQAIYFHNNPESSYSLLADNNRFAFNEFLKIGVEHGIFGLIFSIVLICFALFKKVKIKDERKKQTLIIARALLITLITFGFFSYPFSILQFQLLLVLSLAVISAAYPTAFQTKSFSFKYNYAFYNVLIVLFMCLIVFSFKTHYKYISSYSDAFTKWNKSLKSFYEDPISSISNLKDLYPILSENPDYLYTYGHALKITGLCNESIKIFEHTILLSPSYDALLELGECYEKTGQYTKAKNCWLKAAHMIPSRFSPEYMLAKMYVSIGNTPEAKNLINSLLNRKPKLSTPEYYDLIIKIQDLDSEINLSLKPQNYFK